MKEKKLSLLFQYAIRNHIKKQKKHTYASVKKYQTN